MLCLVDHILEIYHRTLRARLRYDLVARGWDRWGPLGTAGDRWGPLGIAGDPGDHWGSLGTGRCCNGYVMNDGCNGQNHTSYSCPLPPEWATIARTTGARADRRLILGPSRHCGRIATSSRRPHSLFPPAQYDAGISLSVRSSVSSHHDLAPRRLWWQEEREDPRAIRG